MYTVSSCMIRGSPLKRGIQYYVHSIFLYGQGFATQERNTVLCTQYLLVWSGVRYSREEYSIMYTVSSCINRGSPLNRGIQYYVHGIFLYE